MDQDLYTRLVYEEKLLQQEQTELTKRLDVLEPYRNCKLKMHKSKAGHIYYYVKMEGAEKYKYLGKEHSTNIDCFNHLTSACRNVYSYFSAKNSRFTLSFKTLRMKSLTHERVFQFIQNESIF